MSKYRKLLVAIGGFCTTLGLVLADGDVTNTEKIILAGAAATAVGVFAAKNAPSA